MSPACNLCCVCAVASLLACGSSTSDRPVDHPPLDPGFTLTAVGVVTLLGQPAPMRVSLTSTGYAGPITFTTSGVPVEWMVSPPLSIPLPAFSTIDTTILVRVPATGPWPDGGGNMQVTATGTAGSRTAMAAITLQPPEFTVDRGTGSGPHWGSWRDSTVYLPTGTVVRFGNADTVDHSFVASGTLTGMPGAFTFSPGSFATFTPEALGTVTIVCNLHGAAEGAFTIAVTTRTLPNAAQP